MPIHFRCRSCQRRLSVGTHKAGQQVKCPKCAAVLWVPSKEESAALAAMSGDAATTELAGYEFDEPQPVVHEETPRSRPGPPNGAQHDLVPIPRRMLYAQGVLISLVALLAFVLGYLMRGEPAPVGPDGAEERTAAGPVRVEGRLTYESPEGQPAPDAGAVVLLLPSGRVPDERIPPAGLSPVSTAEDERGARAIESLGGAYQRTDASGQFTLILPAPGSYYLLRLSKHAKRPGPASIPSQDLAELNRFFQPAADLLAEQKYTWSRQDIAGQANLSHDFGPSGR